MHRWKLARSRLLCFVLVVGQQAAMATSAEPVTVKALLAEEDAKLAKQLVNWNHKQYKIPDDMVLDPALREAADGLLRGLQQRMQAEVTAWVAEERAASKRPNARAADLANGLHVRATNEMALLSVESAGAAYDEAWRAAALAPRACELVSAAPFVRLVGLIQSAPQADRPVLIEALRELLSRWGTARQKLAARPSTTELAAADQAIARLRERLPVAAAPMSPVLAKRVFARDRSAAVDRWERCARSQWWLRSQLEDGKTDPAQALAVYRYSMMLDVRDLVPPSYRSKPRTGQQAQAKPAYPPVASYFMVEGTMTLDVRLDSQGKPVDAVVVARDIRVPGVRHNRPVAFETLLDEASVAFARQRSYTDGKAQRGRFELSWRLDEDDDEAP